MALAPSPPAAQIPVPLDIASWQPEPAVDALAVLAGAAAPGKHASCWRLPLPELGGSSRAEFWSVGASRTEVIGDGELLVGGDWLAGRIELSEDGDLAGATERAYRALVDHGERLGFPHLIRIWNYLGAITVGDGDDERYKQFCVGRARVIASRPPHGYAAATAIGVPGETGRLSLFWLAGRAPAIALENPRQSSAWTYPRRYGPVAPGFSRAMLVPDGAAPLLLVSGTAAIVGHASVPGDTLAQLDETLANVAALIDRAGAQLERTAALGTDSLLRVYLRDPAEAAAVRTRLIARLGATTPFMLLHGDICRRELSIEIEAVQRFPGVR